MHALVLTLVLAAAPVDSAAACWLLVDEKTSEDAERERRAALEAQGFRLKEELPPLLTDRDHDARTKWVRRGTRRDPVRLLRFER